MDLRPQRATARVALASLLAVLLGVYTDGATRAADTRPLGPTGDGGYLVATSQMVRPAGRQVTFPSRAYDLALSPNGRTLAILGNNAVLLLDVARAAITRTVPISGGCSYLGIRFSPDGKTLFASTIRDGLVAAGVEPPAPPHTIAFAATGRSKGELPAGIALLGGGRRAAVCLNRTNELALVDLDDGSVTARIPVGVAPVAVVASPDGAVAYVANWGGRIPQAGDPTADTAGTQMVVSRDTGAAASGSVSVVDLGAGKVVREVSVGLHPCALALAARGTRLFVANAASDTISVIDTKTYQTLESISVKPAAHLPFGSAPTAICLSKDGRTLYVALGTNNAVAVVSLGSRAGGSLTALNSRVIGLIPVGWYPDALALTADGRSLLVANAKGQLSHYRSQKPPASGPSQYRVTQPEGSVSIVRIPGQAMLARWTKVALDAAGTSRIAEQRSSPSRRPVPVPARIGDPSLIKHVIYIIKENRTYDQVFGDIPKGNGEKSLVFYGEDVTPNHHALASEFVLLDNYYCSGVVSADGHQWTDEAYATDYIERSFGGWPRSYPFDGGDPLAYAPSGFLWDNAVRHGLSFRNYGEMVKASISPLASWGELYRDYTQHTNKIAIRASTTIAPLRPYTHPRYIGFPLVVSDQWRADQFLEEFAQFQRDGNLPNLIIMALPANHTSGTTPGMPTPRASVADNDLALGRIVEAVSHSRFWPQTAIFVTEDDAQNGVDHVDGHRTVGLVISPYTRRGKLVSTLYTQVNMVRTIEQILGLPPMNQIDAAASPMVDCFAEKPDLTPYTCRPNRVPLDELNPPLKALSGDRLMWAMRSAALNWNDVDAADWDTLNRVLWHDAKGYDRPYPSITKPSSADSSGRSQIPAENALQSGTFRGR